MRHALTGSGLLLVLLTTGCPSPEEICKTGVDQTCERNFECQPSEVRDSPQFQAAFGTSVEDCKARLYANPLAPLGQQGIACEAVEEDQQLCANLGQPDKDDFKLGPARDCFDAREKLSCEDYLAQQREPSRAPTACAQRCE